MRAVVVVALVGLLSGGAWAAEGCIVRGTRALPLKVKAEGEAFVFFRADEYRVRVEAEPYVVSASEPLKFRGVLGMPLPSMRIAGKLKLGGVWLAGAEVKLVETHGRRALVDVNLDGVFAWRTEVECVQLEMEAAEPARKFPNANARVKTRLLHVGSAVGDASPIALTVTDREHALVNVRRRQAQLAYVEGYFAHGAVVGWVPANELESRVVERSHGAILDPSSEKPVAPVAPEKSHRARVVAGATVYAAAGKGAWATTARELREWIADGRGAWVEVRSMGEHVWVRREAVVEGWSARSLRQQRRQSLARAVQP